MATVSWITEDRRRMLHPVYRVDDLDESIEFYKKAFGMKLHRRRDVPEEKYSLAFLGYGDEKSNTSLELTHNHGKRGYDKGAGFGHFALASTDIYKMAEHIKTAGGSISREPGPVKGGTTHIAFVKDPSGYSFELVQREKESREPLNHIMLRVGNLDKSIEFYTKVLGCRLIRRSENPDNRYTLVFLGYDDEGTGTQFELTYNWDTHSYDLGDAYAHVALATDDVYKTAEQVRAAGGKVVKEPTALPGLGTKIMALTDPDGYKIVFVDNKDFLKELE
ncbi:hypothetical protein H632_c154p1 [Helicosporidium sp. ATCC 50920]|nr:hypothetical protein H632_c154p1 [Helicosporidium sp. ATCC 50920]|eukprot:KDD76633.1 hypothetical protein H632_c154p1 [Helicosporidium sp. ATCC 50920]